MIFERHGNLGKLNHVAIAVPDLDKATALYRDVLGAKVSEKHVSNTIFNQAYEFCDYNPLLNGLILNLQFFSLLFLILESVFRQATASMKPTYQHSFLLFLGLS